MRTHLDQVKQYTNERFDVIYYPGVDTRYAYASAHCVVCASISVLEARLAQDSQSIGGVWCRVGVSYVSMRCPPQFETI